jgi:hypothetical protein
MDDAISAALKRGISDQHLMPGVPVPPMPEVISVPSGFGPFDAAAMQQRYERLMIFEGIGFVLLGLVLWRWGVGRGRRQAAGEQGDPQLRQAVDAIAIEVERISENQRYVTKLLAEQHQAAGISRPQSEAERVARDAR